MQCGRELGSPRDDRAGPRALSSFASREGGQERHFHTHLVSCAEPGTNEASSPEEGLDYDLANTS